MLRAAWKSLVARKLRLVLTALSIVLGVGFVSGTYVLTDTIDQASGDPIGGFGPPTLGMNWTELAGRVFTIRQGGPPTGPGEVAIDAGTASTYGLEVGDRVPILFETGREEFEIVGVLGFGDA